MLLRLRGVEWRGREEGMHLPDRYVLCVQCCTVWMYSTVDEGKETWGLLLVSWRYVCTVQYCTVLYI